MVIIVTTYVLRDHESILRVFFLAEKKDHIGLYKKKFQIFDVFKKFLTQLFRKRKEERRLFKSRFRKTEN